MHRHPSRPVEHHPTVRAGRPAAQQSVLRADRRDGRESGADEADRQAVSANAVLRQPQDGAGTGHQSQACSATDAVDGLGGRGRQATHHATGRRTQDLPVFAAESGDHATRPGVGQRHHLHSVATRLFVPDGGDGLVQSLRVGLAVVEHAGRKILPGSTRRGAGHQARRRFSTAIKEASSRRLPSRAD